MIIVDYIFFRVYIFCLQCKLFRRNTDIWVSCIVWLVIILPWVYCLSAMHLIPHLPRYIALPIMLITMVPFEYRYTKQPKIIKDDYSYFRSMWENETSHIRRRRGALIITLFVANFIVIPGVLFLFQFYDII